MSVRQCFISLGSNIGDGPAIIQKALARLAQTEGVQLGRVSSLYRTAPWGNTEQAEFTNAVAELETLLEAPELLAGLLGIERELGRNRDTGHWGPRLIDLDLLTYGDELINRPGLIVPHPHMHERAFVLVPLLELEPEFEIPGLGRAVVFQQQFASQPVRKIPRSNITGG